MAAEPKTKAAIFVESHEGYGHFNIVSQLMKQLEEKGAEVMVLSGTLNYAGAAQTFNMRDSRIVHLPLVDYRIAKNGRWEYLTQDGERYEDSPEAIAARKKTVRAALENFRPDILISELFPFQQSFRQHDMAAAEEWSGGSGVAPVRVALCRDIIHNSNPKKVIELLDRHYDHLLVRGDERFSKLTDSQQEWQDIRLPIEYMGNYITPMPERSREPDGQRHVVVFGGGGYFDKDLPFFEGVIKARAHSQKFADRLWDIYISENAAKHFVDDPDDPTKKITAFSYLEKLAVGEGHGMIRVFPPIDSKKFRKELADAAMVITRGGYNVTFELFAAHQHQLVIPRSAQEQVQRANTLYEHGIAQIYPDYPIDHKESYRSIRRGLENPQKLAREIDDAPDIKASVPELQNHGAKRTAERVFELVRDKRKDESLTLLIVYENNKIKKRDAEEIAGHLETLGHQVVLADAQSAKIAHMPTGPHLRQEGKEDIPLAAFDGATLRAPVEVTESKVFSDALRVAGVPVYQDYDMLVAGGDKLLSQRVFEANGIATPKTLGVRHSEVPRASMLEEFMDGLGAGPYVVKSARGWSGKQVKIADGRDEAIEAFMHFHLESRREKAGGALMQEFIESDPVRRSDYRIQIVVGVDTAGKPSVEVVAAARRMAQPGERITNVSRGADKIRVSLSEDEARKFYLGKSGMPEEEFRTKLATGDIEILSPELKAAAEKAALAFGPGSMGVDIVVGRDDKTPRLIEVNPFAGGSGNFEEVHGFSIFKPWADAFAGHVRHKRKEKENAGRWESAVRGQEGNTAPVRA